MTLKLVVNQTDDDLMKAKLALEEARYTCVRCKKPAKISFHKICSSIIFKPYCESCNGESEA